MLPKIDEASTVVPSSTELDYTILEMESINDIYRRKIFEEFLDKEPIKLIIYNMLFLKN
jgi:hypothetical protein